MYKMSLGDDNQLKVLVTQCLESSGILPKIRAELRASVFIALEEEQRELNNPQLYDTAYKDFIRTNDGKLMFLLVREFMEYFKFESTASVYEAESNMNLSCKYHGRAELIRELNLSELPINCEGPLLLHVLKLAGLRDILNTTYTKSNTTQDLSFGETGDNSAISNDSEPMCNTPKPITEIRATLKTSIEKNVNTEVVSPVVSSRSNLSSHSASINELYDKDDTFDGTSSITEDSIKSSHSTVDDSPRKSLENTPVTPISDKPTQSSDKIEKTKTVNLLTSLQDLPPLSFTKSRPSDSVLLPSLYPKDKDKSSDKECLFDMDLDSLDNYEEDFMSSGETEHVHKKNYQIPVISRSDMESFQNKAAIPVRKTHENRPHHNLIDMKLSAILKSKFDSNQPVLGKRDDGCKQTAPDIVNATDGDSVKCPDDESGSISEELNFDEEVHST